MSAKWVSHSSDASRRLGELLQNAANYLSQPDNARRVRRALVVVLILWAVFSLSQLIWAWVPSQGAAEPTGTRIANPVSLPAAAGEGQQVNIARVQGWHLFGEVNAQNDSGQDQRIEEPEPSARDGIEEGARATRLALKLRGVVASTDDGLGYAVIEHQSKQDIYAVEDELPVPGQVTLAKVMPRQVVLDNRGTYELLELFDDSGLDAQLVLQPPPEPTPIEEGEDEGASAVGDASTLARSYRDRLYQNPQALADVVAISAVRENGELQGYRVMPGKEREQFAVLGFRPGDLVTSINGMSLSDPANTLRLYQTIRSASEAVFELQRDGQPMSISVSLEEGGEL
ncbi:MAG: type II secretion system protein GspC [Pseudomonadota bacterium]